MISIEDEDKQILINSIKLPNAKYGHALMSVCSKYQVFSEDDIQFLLDQKKCKAAFSSDFAMLRLISDPTQISRIVKDASGYNRYYPEGYEFGGNIYAFTSQLYGYKENGSHRDNRTPFYKWVLGKLRILEEDDEEGEKAVPISINEAISQIKKYIASRGFTYNDKLIENFFLD